jgi:hypothetical protein
MNYLRRKFPPLKAVARLPQGPAGTRSDPLLRAPVPALCKPVASPQRMPQSDRERSVVRRRAPASGDEDVRASPTAGRLAWHG